MTFYRRLLSMPVRAALDGLHAAGNSAGTTPDDDLDVLAGLVVASRAQRILQFGTFLGGSAIVLADLARANGPEATVVTVDPNPAMTAAAAQLAQAADVGAIVQAIDGQSTDPATLAGLKDKRWDLIYLDTTHQYDATYAELHALTPLCGPATLLALHDASSFAAETLDVGRQGGVKRAMAEFVLLNPRWQSFVFEARPFGKYGIGLLQRKAGL